MTDKLVVFQGKQVRRVLHNDEWYFSVVDIIAALTDSTDPKQYVKKMRSRDPELNSYWGTICTPLELPTPDGRIRPVKLREHSRHFPYNSVHFVAKS